MSKKVLNFIGDKMISGKAFNVNFSYYVYFQKTFIIFRCDSISRTRHVIESHGHNVKTLNIFK